jgi:hypothetical protein
MKLVLTALVTAATVVVVMGRFGPSDEPTPPDDPRWLTWLYKDQPR